MADTNLKQPNQQNRGQQKGSQDPQRQQDMRETKRAQGKQGETDEPSGVAHDRGGDREPRSFSSEREADELGSELERETGIEGEDDEGIDSPGRGRSNR